MKIVFVVLVILLAFVYRGIWENYAFMDDFIQLNSRGWDDKDMLVQGGRIFMKLSHEFFYSMMDEVADVRYGRTFSFLYLCIFIFLLLGDLQKAKFEKYECGLLVLVCVLIPSVVIYLGWLAVGVALLAVIFSYLGGRFFLQKRYFWAIFFIFLSLNTYQSSASAFFLPIVIARQRFLRGFILYFCSLFFYFLFLKLYLWFYFQIDGVTVSRRTDLIELVKVPSRIWWFLAEVLPSTVLRGWRIGEGDLKIVSFSLLILFILLVLKVFGKKGFYIFALIPVIYLPNLISNEEWAPFRTVFVLAIFLNLVFFICLHELMGGAFLKRIFLLVCVMLIFYEGRKMKDTLDEKMVAVQKLEQKLLRREIKKAVKMSGDVYFVTPNWDAHSHEVYWDELNFPSTFHRRQLRHAVEFQLRSIKGDSDNFFYVKKLDVKSQNVVSLDKSFKKERDKYGR